MRPLYCIVALLGLFAFGCTAPVELLPPPVAVTAWSEPVNGIVTRIEQADIDFFPKWYVPLIYVRIYNLTDHSLMVPVASRDQGPEYSVSLFIKGKWETVVEDEPDRRRDNISAQYELKPGEDLLCEVHPPGLQRFRFAEAARVTISVTDSHSDTAWHGTITTPPVAAYVPKEVLEKTRGTLPLPSGLPSFSNEAWNVNGPADMPDFTGLTLSNWAFLNELQLYSPADVAAALDQQRASMPNTQLKLLLTTESAARGSKTAIQELNGPWQPTTHETVKIRAAALIHLLRQDHAPDWCVTLAVEMLNDERREQNSHDPGGQTVKYTAAEDLAFPLGWTDNPSGLPALIQLASQPKCPDDVLFALESSGDVRAEPAVLKILADELARLPDRSSRYSGSATDAVGRLRCRKAVPLLLAHIGDSRVVCALGNIGDPAAIPAIEAQLAHERAKPAGSKAMEACDEVSLAKLLPGDSTPRVAALLSNKMADAFDLIHWLERNPDPRAVPELLQFIQTTDSDAAAYWSVASLSKYRGPAAITALISILNMDLHRFEKNRNSAWSRSDRDIEDRAVQSLREITGCPFGVDLGHWQQWWEGVGKNDPRFQ